MIFFFKRSFSSPIVFSPKLFSSDPGENKKELSWGSHLQAAAAAPDASKLFVNNRFYKQSGSLGIACPKLSVDDKFYKQSGPCGTTSPGLSINNRFYKRFWYPGLHRRGRRRLEKVFFFKSYFLQILGKTKKNFPTFPQLQRNHFPLKKTFLQKVISFTSVKQHKKVKNIQTQFFLQRFFHLQQQKQNKALVFIYCWILKNL